MAEAKEFKNVCLIRLHDNQHTFHHMILLFDALKKTKNVFWNSRDVITRGLEHIWMMGECKGDRIVKPLGFCMITGDPQESLTIEMFSTFEPKQGYGKWMLELLYLNIEVPVKKCYDKPFLIKYVLPGSEKFWDKMVINGLIEVQNLKSVDQKND